MLFQSKTFSSGLVAMVALSIGVSASLDLVEQHLLGRDGGNLNPGSVTDGKLAPAVNLGKVPTNPQAVLKLTGQDLHTEAPPKNNAFEASAILATGDGKGSAAPAGADAGMSVMIDSDESGTTTVAEADSVQGLVVKATSGLYTHTDPDKGSCAKTLAKHGEPCANRPYVVPQSVISGTSSSPATTPGSGTNGQHGPVTKRDPAYHAGPYVLKRDGQEVRQPLGDWKVADKTDNLVFKRDTGSSIRRGPYEVDTHEGGTHEESTGPTGTVCYDTVKRDQEVTKVVPTEAKVQKLVPGEPLNFELVKAEDRENVWHQVIYDKHGKPVDVTHLQITGDFSVWRAEYYCPECKPGHKWHKVQYENIEIETDEEHEHADPTLAVQCEGAAKSTNVHKKKKSRYQDKDQGLVKYSGAIFSIDHVMLGQFDKNGDGAIGSVTVGREKDVAGGYAISPKKPGDLITKREVVEDNGPVF
ncbi:uncharacterized protein UTRI_00164 [Ustilago trichophora]|uniref:EF-hand domain-containing protein n=1 Tax=Ustilago trichophora TaxID=86804 RepID=A0A5C3DQX9_9BASI|nr:uncharacterized protein UTRI_00164 [Ustilago trichophora]